MSRLDPAAIVPAPVHDAWTGTRWRWIALVAGIGLTALLALVALVLAFITSADAASLTMLFLAIGLLLAGLIGAGVLERLSARMIQGGLTRQQLPRPETPEEAETPSDTDLARRDRLTIRAGLITLPMFVLFVILLFS